MISTFSSNAASSCRMKREDGKFSCFCSCPEGDDTTFHKTIHIKKINKKTTFQSMGKGDHTSWL